MLSIDSVFILLNIFCLCLVETVAIEAMVMKK